MVHAAPNPWLKLKETKRPVTSVAAHAAKNQSVTSHNPDDVFRIWPESGLYTEYH